MAVPTEPSIVVIGAGPRPTGFLERPAADPPESYASARSALCLLRDPSCRPRLTA
ncbi:hypothetical protein [Streptomyces sp. NPDC020681]|uniref:hypothetical protein n=1 Tax=Streptomyces sp. NPDC020681 TaxID=3365083 RepID=UPI0037A20800